jgi:hypothetical protein
MASSAADQVGVGWHGGGPAAAGAPPRAGAGQAGLLRRREHLLEEGAQVPLGQRPGEALHQAAAEGQVHRRDALDLQLTGQRLVGVTSTLASTQAPAASAASFSSTGESCLHGPAPGGPESMRTGTASTAAAPRPRRWPR